MLAGGHEQVIKTQGAPRIPLHMNNCMCAHTHTLSHLVSLHVAKAPENLKITHILTTNKYRSKQTENHSHFLFPDWVAPWGQPNQTALALTINILSGLMMLLLLLHQHVSYGCSELKQTHNSTRLLEWQGQPRWVSVEEKEGNGIHGLLTHLVFFVYERLKRSSNT